jgi:hypothetical protein
VVTAFLSESISAVACGSLQIFDEEADEGAVVDVNPGRGVKPLAAGKAV